MSKEDVAHFEAAFHCIHGAHCSICDSKPANNHHLCIDLPSAPDTCTELQLQLQLYGV